jgi:hypothetical protein
MQFVVRQCRSRQRSCFLCQRSVGRIREGQWIRYFGNCVYFSQVKKMKMKIPLILMFICVAATLSAHGQTVQCQTTNGAWGPCPLNASVQLFTLQAANGTATATPQKVYNFSMNGVLIVTYASITGSPAGCTLQVKSGDSLGNLINNSSSISTTPSNGTTSLVFTPAITQQSADQISVVYACGTYPSAGTLSVEFVPSGTGKMGILANSGATIDSTLAAGSAPSNGLAIIGQYNTTVPTPTAGQTVAMQLGPNGNLIDQPYRRSQIITNALSITSNNTAQQLLASQTGFYTDLTSLIISTSSLAPTAPFTVSISDGSKTYVFDLNTDQAVGANVMNIVFNPPLVATSLSTQWTQTNSSSSVTTHTTVVAVKQAASF